MRMSKRIATVEIGSNQWESATRGYEPPNDAISDHLRFIMSPHQINLMLNCFQICTLILDVFLLEN